MGNILTSTKSIVFEGSSPEEAYQNFQIWQRNNRVGLTDIFVRTMGVESTFWTNENGRYKYTVVYWERL